MYGGVQVVWCGKTRLHPTPTKTHPNLVPVKMSLEARLQVATAEYQKIRGDLATAVDARQRLGAQLTENEMVKKVNVSLTVPVFTFERT